MLDEKWKKLEMEWLDEATILNMQEKMESGELTAEALTLMYMETISRRNPECQCRARTESASGADCEGARRRASGTRDAVASSWHPGVVEGQYGHGRHDAYELRVACVKGFLCRGGCFSR